MLSSKRASVKGVLLARGLAIAIVVGAAGCSADVTRFGLGGDSTKAPIVPTGGDLAKAPVYGLGPQQTKLPPLGPPQQDYRVVGRDYAPPAGKPTPASLAPPYVQPAAKFSVSPPPAGESIEVQAGDTLYHIARRHGVAVAAIKDLNGLKSETVRPGQRLVLPATATDRGPLAKAPPPALADSKQKPASDPALNLPPRVVQVTPRIIRAVPEEPKADPAQKTAERTDIVTDALPAPAAGKFRWPVRGKVIVGFGIQPDGAKSDGISLAVPLGADIHAAEAGKVHYIGDGVKGYGNLVLIRHDNDWSTAYAYVDRILVKPGEKVKRGQVIAQVIAQEKAKTGKSEPQLRFELRKSSVPVDPLPHLPN